MSSTSRITLRGLADQYRRMADNETDQRERRKFLRTAAVYDCLASHREPLRAPLSTAPSAVLNKSERAR